MGRDLRYAARTLLRSPGYTVVALLALTLGIGANTTIFSFVDAMLLRPLPYNDADRLFATVSVKAAENLDRASVSYADYEDWRRESDLFAAVALYQPTTASVSGGSEDPERVDSATISDEFFELLDLQPILGRPLTAIDKAPDTASVAVISHGFWQRRFAGDPAALGRQIRVGGVPHTIVGVLGPRAAYPEATQLFLPLVPARFDDLDLARRDNLIFQGLVRLTPGATRQQAEARMRTIAARVEQDHPAARQGWSNALLPLREYVVGSELSTALYVLLAAVGAVLLIACANLASLTLVRGAGRAREMGLRLALGASRPMLIRQLVAESALLGAFGGTLGVLLAAAAIPALAALLPADTPFASQIAIDTRVLLAAAALTLVSVVGVGVFPALSTSSLKVGGAMKEGARGATQGQRTAHIRSALVVAEVAMTVVLLVAASLLVRSLGQISRTPAGADLDRVLAARVAVPGSRYDVLQRVEFFQTLTARLAAAPGVASVSMTSYLPAGGGGFGLGRVFLREGQPEPPASADVRAMWNVIGRDYFRTLGVPLLAGRSFEGRDRRESTPVMIVSEAFANRMFPGQNSRDHYANHVIGQRVRSWRDENRYREIVGVVSDVPFSSLSDRDQALVYVPHAQQGWGGMTLTLRAAAGAPETLAPLVRRTVKALDPELALSDVGTMAMFARDSIARERLSAWLMAGLAALALALSVLGVYGVLSYSVALRRQELGVRLALGAAPGDLYRLVLRSGLTLTVVGVGIGFVGALAAGRALGSLLYDTSAFDPVSFAGMTTLLGVTAVVACIVPARRAAASDPLVALRSE